MKLKALNTVLKGDCLERLQDIPDQSVDLIYLDPPFFTQRLHSLKNKDASKTFSFQDEWGDLNEYVSYIKTRLIALKPKLKKTGSLFLHCDKTASHYLKIALDEVFGFDQFRSEIIWSYKRWSNSKKGLLNNHQVIFFYSKADSFKFNTLYEKYSVTTNVDQIVQKRVRDRRNKSIYQVNPDTGAPELVSAKRGVPLGDVWSIPFLNPKAKERVSYPTQKPVLLLEKIIEIATDKGDVVLDPFCGSGTTLVAAKLLHRKFIGIDQSADAVDLSNARLAKPFKTESDLLKKGEDEYDKQSLSIKKIVNELKATLVHRNKGIDGLISSRKKIIPFKVVQNIATLEEAAGLIYKSTQKNKYPQKALYVRDKVSKQLKKKIEDKYDVIIFSKLSQLQKI
jgi:site-specific DNA-methyltransferase (adenine-specific)